MTGSAHVVTLALAAALAFVACGGGSDSTPAATAPSGTEAVAATATAPEALAGAVELTWWGQAMFVLRAPDGTGVLLDPYGDIGYRLPDAAELDVDAVTVSHEHFDHNNVALGSGATVLRGLTADGYAEIDEQVGEVVFRTVASFHDEEEGAARGRNAIFILEVAGLRIVHLGDLGHRLSDEQIAAIGEVDVLLVPVGGFFTIDAAAATDVVGQTAPRVVIPMHYGTDAVAIEQLAPVDGFLQGKAVDRFASGVALSLDELPEPGSAAVWVLEPAGG